jgi:hypothetical protein
LYRGISGRQARGEIGERGGVVIDMPASVAALGAVATRERFGCPRQLGGGDCLQRFIDRLAQRSRQLHGPETLPLWTL